MGQWVSQAACLHVRPGSDGKALFYSIIPLYLRRAAAPPYLPRQLGSNTPPQWQSHCKKKITGLGVAHGHNKGEKDKKIRVDVVRLEGIEPPMIASEGLMTAHQQRPRHVTPHLTAITAFA